MVPLWMACSKPEPQANPYPTGSLKEQLMADYTRFGVNMHSYEFFDTEDTPAPKGYKPFYISHYGRHGSRSNWGNKDYCHVIAVLDSAKQEGVLTPAGDTLLVRTQQVLAAYNDMDGRLTDRGEREHVRIAERMYKRYPEVFIPGEPRIISIGSLVPRCLISMAAFTNRLTQLNRRVRYDFDTGEQTQKYIDCCGNVSDEVRERYHAVQDSLLSTLPYDSTVVMERLFTAQPSVMKDVSLEKLQQEIFMTCAIAQDFDIALNVMDYMAFETAYYYQMRATWYIALRFCNVEGCGAKRIQNAQIALDEIVQSADSAMKHVGDMVVAPIVANLRFGHDYPLLCIVNLMGIDGVGTPMKPEDIEASWFGHLNICMASNVQLVFYRNADKWDSDTLVKVLYNERERQIMGLTPVEGPYYKWKEVRKKWKG